MATISRKMGQLVGICKTHKCEDANIVAAMSLDIIAQIKPADIGVYTIDAAIQVLESNKINPENYLGLKTKEERARKRSEYEQKINSLNILKTLKLLGKGETGSSSVHLDQGQVQKVMDETADLAALQQVEQMEERERRAREVGDNIKKNREMAEALRSLPSPPNQGEKGGKRTKKNKKRAKGPRRVKTMGKKRKSSKSKRKKRKRYQVYIIKSKANKF